MTDDLERTLRAALDAEARARVGDSAPLPPARFLDAPATSRRHRAVRLLAPLAAAAAVVAGAAVLALANSSSHGGSNQAAVSGPATGVSAPPTANASAVHVRLLNDDGARYGVGMPVIAYFSQRVTDGRALQRATVVTVNGQRQDGAWYFEKSAAGKGPVEAHLRLAGPWPAYASVRVSMPIQGLSAGGALRYDDSLTTEFTTGADNVATVDEATHLMTVLSDGKKVGAYHVSLGAKTSPTRSGTKVIMERRPSITLEKPVDGHATVQYAQRLTYSGEYLCAAPWSEKAIATRRDSSAGSTYLSTADAAALYDRLEIGDRVVYKGVPGAPMRLASGYGDWNVPWSVWMKGGLVPTR